MKWTIPAAILALLVNGHFCASSGAQQTDGTRGRATTSDAPKSSSSGTPAEETVSRGVGGARKTTDSATAHDTVPKLNMSAAERINGIQKLYEADQKRQGDLKDRLEKLAAEFEIASTDFSRVDAQRSAANADQTIGKKTQLTAEQRAALETRWKQVRNRFDHIILQRKVIQQQIDVLTEKLAVEKAALDRATSTEGPAKNVEEDRSTVAAAAASQQDAPARATGAAPSQPATPPAAIPAAAAPTSTSPTSPAAARTPPIVDDKLVEAQKELKAKRDALKQAEDELKTREHTIDVFERDLSVAQELLALAEQDYREALPQQALIKEELDTRRAADAPQAELDDLAKRRDEIANRLHDLGEEVKEQTARVTESQRLLTMFGTLRTQQMEGIKKAQAEVQSAETHVQFLQSPVAPHRLWRWLAQSGPGVLGVLAAMVACWWLARIAGKRVVAGIFRRTVWSSEDDRQGRAETLRRVFQSSASTAIVVVGGLALLNQAGIDVTVLLGGAAVLGAAIAFGSQNLIKDYFSGFMVLVENQYSVGHVVRIGGVCGTVEDITLRITALRDEEGVVHFIPHSQATMVSNLTHGWSQAVFRIGIGYDEDVDRAIAVLNRITKEFYRDEQFTPYLIGKPNMLGVDGFEENAVMIKFLVRTRPLKQWLIKHEMLRRIKAEYDAASLKLPLPQRAAYAASALANPQPATKPVATPSTNGSAAPSTMESA